ncbi:Cupin 4 family protein [Candidatus Methylopumilus turicensis]|uniref:Cupin 4 family protein n=2 Tax=Candidatus Methylopumilus turicensis TaxID=1581680 RepID=A0A0B7IYK2_9PROT|nr:Cupin 4 family protein [Candidatus Methylopumilus turicensis]
MRYHRSMKKNSNSHSAPLTLLGGISAETFLKEYWHKKPLLIRGAMPDFEGFLTPNELAGLACEEDVQSRLISYVKKVWKLEQGPFAEKRFAKLPDRDWTLLVQSVNHHMQEANDLLQQFNFIPQARLDDLMVSYAPDGGGVGPHFDSYDVFLLQGCGQRIWHISEQEDLTLVEGAPLRILKHFNTEQTFTLSAGDMLYLPPQVAHWGIAVGDCMTYSIGFRAPTAQELAGKFLDYLHERRRLSGRYADPELAPQANSAVIGQAMVAQVSSILDGLKWGDEDVADFLGQYLTEPKSHVVFDSPKQISQQAFEKRMKSQGIQLSFKSQLLIANHVYYLNGEAITIEADAENLLAQLSNTRKLTPQEMAEATNLGDAFIAEMHAWYLAGCIIFLQ